MLAVAAPAARAQTAALPPGVAMGELTRLTATAETVDTTTREVLLRGEGSNLVIVRAGPEVRNLAQAQPGDRVVLDYQEAIAGEIVRPGDARPPVGGVAVAGRSGDRVRVPSAE